MGETNQVQIYNKITSNSVKLRFLIELLNQLPTKEQKNDLIKDIKPSSDMRSKLIQAKKQGLLLDPTQ